MTCIYHQGEPATHTVVRVDRDNCTEHNVRYKRVPVCERCACEAGNTDQCIPIGATALAFEGLPVRGYTVKVWYLEPLRDQRALVEIFLLGVPYRRFEVEALRVWNVAVHFEDIVDEIEQGATDATAK
jgi:hypothetical protein